MKTEKPLIQVSGLYKSFGENRVLQGVNITFPPRKISAIIGKSGTGKSVLIKNIIGIMKPEAGDIHLEGRNLTTLPEEELRLTRRRFGYLFQGAALFDSMTVAENIAFPVREVLGIHDKGKTAEIVREKLEWINLPGIEEKYPSELSGGMRKRVGLARTLAGSPDIVLFDEPTTGLDPVLGEAINNLINRVNKELNITCIVISHDIIGTFQFADQISFLHEGKIQASGSRADMARSRHPVMRKFLENSFTELKL